MIAVCSRPALRRAETAGKRSRSDTIEVGTGCTLGASWLLAQSKFDHARRRRPTTQPAQHHARKTTVEQSSTNPASLCIQSGSRCSNGKYASRLPTMTARQILGHDPSSTCCLSPAISPLFTSFISGPGRLVCQRRDGPEGHTMGAKGTAWQGGVGADRPAAGKTRVGKGLTGAEISRCRGNRRRRCVEALSQQVNHGLRSPHAYSATTYTVQADRRHWRRTTTRNSAGRPLPVY